MSKKERIVSYQDTDNRPWKRWVAEKQIWCWSGGEWGSYGWSCWDFATARTREKALDKLQKKLDKADRKEAEWREKARANSKAAAARKDKRKETFNTTWAERGKG